ncbi:hypothetical protein EYF80_054557 [Liparis tanakae]|uniref:Uncharacterized protein n=1 Tax=Liparis tanakae TaxID=230148 RepID=A0A4Z2F456_9TELE|nr:hypothetical protein EYF80_054557 [Liparis tanakae]
MRRCFRFSFRPDGSEKNLYGTERGGGQNGSEPARRIRITMTRGGPGPGREFKITTSSSAVCTGLRGPLCEDSGVPYVRTTGCLPEEYGVGWCSRSAPRVQLAVLSGVQPGLEKAPLRMGLYWKELAWLHELKSA